MESRLALLNRECIFLLQEGILTIYIDICGILKSCKKSKIRPAISNLLKEIRQSFSRLLLYYFIYQEYLTRKESSNL
jgi:hypothetical protein